MMRKFPNYLGSYVVVFNFRLAAKLALLAGARCHVGMKRTLRNGQRAGSAENKRGSARRPVSSCELARRPKRSLLPSGSGWAGQLADQTNDMIMAEVGPKNLYASPLAKAQRAVV